MGKINSNFSSLKKKTIFFCIYYIININIYYMFNIIKYGVI